MTPPRPGLEPHADSGAGHESERHRARVAVITPLHNGAATIGETLDSIRAQTTDVDVVAVVVNDRSSDAGVAIARQHPLAPLVIDSPRPGASGARNAGWRAARAHTEGPDDVRPFSAVVFVDADDLLLPGALAARVAQLAGQPAATFLVNAFVDLWPDGSRSRHNVGGMEAAAFFRRSKAPPIALTFAPDLLGDAPFREDVRYFEDWQLTLRLVASGVTPLYAPRVDCVYRQRAQMAMSAAAAVDDGLRILDEAGVLIGDSTAPNASERRAWERNRRLALADMWLWRAWQHTRARKAAAVVDIARALKAAPANAPAIPFYLASRFLARVSRRRKLGLSAM